VTSERPQGASPKSHVGRPTANATKSRESATEGRKADVSAEARSAKPGLPAEARSAKAGQAGGKPPAPPDDRETRRQAQIEARRRDRAAKAHQAKIAELEERIARCETEIKQIETTMASPEFYQDRAASQPVIDRHQALMWQVGDLMHQWEELQTSHEAQPSGTTSPSTRN
jgi:hypothetical protein